MIEERGDIFAVSYGSIVIPTNCIIKDNGEAVMGRGVAAAARKKFPGIEKLLGAHIAKWNDLPYARFFPHKGPFSAGKVVVCVPTKYDWRDESDLALIEQGVKYLSWLRDCEMIAAAYDKVCLPRLGCGLGGLDWETQVKPLLDIYLDDNFVVITP